MLYLFFFAICARTFANERVCPLEIERHRSQTQFELAQESVIGDFYKLLGLPSPQVWQIFLQIGRDRDPSSWVLETIETSAKLQMVKQGKIQYQSSSGRTAQGSVGLIGA